MIKTYRSGFKFRPLVRDNLLSNGKVAYVVIPSLSGVNNG